MVEDRVPARCRRLGAYGMMFRRRRVFARLREGFTYEEIANEEGVTIARIRQIVSAELQQRSVDSGADHAKLQLERLASVMQLAAKAVAAGDVTAITPYLKVLDRLDRYQTVASVNQVYDDEGARSSWTRSTAWPPISVSTRSSTRRRTSISRSLGRSSTSRARPKETKRTWRARRRSRPRRMRASHSVRKPQRARIIFP
jgi:hypothetical protein